MNLSDATLTGADVERLSPAELREWIAAQKCPWCRDGRVWRVLAGHTSRSHQIDTKTLREMAGLTYSESICDPATAERLAEHSKKISSRLFTPEALARRTGRPRDVSPAGKAKMAACARLAHEKTKAREKRAAHGTFSRYRHWGCRCEACIAAMRAYARDTYSRIKQDPTRYARRLETTRRANAAARERAKARAASHAERIAASCKSQ